MAYESRSDKEEEQKRAQKRETFEKNLKRNGLELEREELAVSFLFIVFFIVHALYMPDIKFKGASFTQLLQYGVIISKIL